MIRLSKFRNAFLCNLIALKCDSASRMFAHLLMDATQQKSLSANGMLIGPANGVHSLFCAPID